MELVPFKVGPGTNPQVFNEFEVNRTSNNQSTLEITLTEGEDSGAKWERRGLEWGELIELPFIASESISLLIKIF